MRYFLFLFWIFSFACVHADDQWRAKLERVRQVMFAERYNDWKDASELRHRLKELGNALSPEEIDEASGELNRNDLEILRIAQEYALHPEYVEELLGWYAAPADDITPETIHGTRAAMLRNGFRLEDLPREKVMGVPAKRPGNGVPHNIAPFHELLPYHLRAEYKTPWKVVLLLRKKTPIRHCDEAVFKFSDAKMVPVLMLYFHSVEVDVPDIGSQPLKRHRIVSVLNLLDAIGSKEALLGMADIWEYAKPEITENGAFYPIRTMIEYWVAGPHAKDPWEAEDRGFTGWRRFIPVVDELLGDQSVLPKEREFLLLIKKEMVRDGK